MEIYIQTQNYIFRRIFRNRCSYIAQESIVYTRKFLKTSKEQKNHPTVNIENMWMKESICWRDIWFLYISWIYSVLHDVNLPIPLKIIVCYVIKVFKAFKNFILKTPFQKLSCKNIKQKLTPSSQYFPYGC